MFIYKKVKRFDEITGKPKFEKAYAEVRCDFTGVVLSYDDKYCCYPLDYGSVDPCFGAGDDEEYAFGQKYDIDMHCFLSPDYHFASNGGGIDRKDCAEAMMMREALAGAKKKNEWYCCFTFDSMCRHARIRTATKLIESGEIKPHDLIQ